MDMFLCVLAASLDHGPLQEAKYFLADYHKTHNLE